MSSSSRPSLLGARTGGSSSSSSEGVGGGAGGGEGEEGPSKRQKADDEMGKMNWTLHFIFICAYINMLVYCG